jgi:tetratricopeptide (TPR) repeat protein
MALSAPNSDQQVLSQRQEINVLLNTAVAYHQEGRFPEANLLYAKVRSIDPNNHSALQLSGVLAAQTGNIEISLNLLSRALSLKPDYPEALSNRGNVLQKLGRFDEALQDYNKAISLKPDYIDALYNRGISLKELGRFDEAMADYNEALSLKPDYPEALNNRGSVLQKLGRFDEALQDYNKAISLRPDHVEALNSRGFALQELGRFDEAMADYNKALSLKPDYPEAHLNKSLQLLRQGEFTSGWESYEWRWKSSSFTTPVREFSQPLWLGEEDLYGKTILLHWEQGFGDTIQFSRYAKEVSRLGCKTILEVQKPLFELMKTIEGVDELIASGTDLPPFDFYCPLMSLPLAMGTTLDTIPLGEPYLNSVDDKLAKWSSRLGPKSNLRVGMVWSGNAKHKNDHNRSIALEQMLSAIPEGYELVSLQKEVRETDLTVLEKTKQVRHFGAELDDFSDTAALCDLMDVIISVDTSVAHLAGALGKPLKLLLPDNSDFRWLLDRSDSPWYPSMRLFAQGIDKLWEPVLEKINDDLKCLFKQHRA